MFAWCQILTIKTRNNIPASIIERVEAEHHSMKRPRAPHHAYPPDGLTDKKIVRSPAKDFAFAPIALSGSPHEQAASNLSHYFVAARGCNRNHACSQ
jgi:hypothetical protein